MKISLLMLLLLLPFWAKAQLTRQLTNKSAYFLEQFEVRAEAPDVKEGTYQKFTRRTHKLFESGTYLAGQRTGVWTFYSQSGQSDLVYDYSQKTIVLLNRTNVAASVAQFIEADTLRTVVVDREPVYLASSVQIYETLGRNARFPTHLAKAGLTDISFKVLATVSPSGTSFRIMPSHADGQFIRESKQAAVEAFAGVDWVLAIYRQRPVTAVYFLGDVKIHAYTN